MFATRSTAAVGWRAGWRRSWRLADAGTVSGEACDSSLVAFVPVSAVFTGLVGYSSTGGQAHRETEATSTSPSGAPVAAASSSRKSLSIADEGSSSAARASSLHSPDATTLSGTCSRTRSTSTLETAKDSDAVADAVAVADADADWRVAEGEVLIVPLMDVEGLAAEEPAEHGGDGAETSAGEADGHRCRAAITCTGRWMMEMHMRFAVLLDAGRRNCAPASRTHQLRTPKMRLMALGTAESRDIVCSGSKCCASTSLLCFDSYPLHELHVPCCLMHSGMHYLSCSPIS